MIITLTLNPALDKTASISPLIPGGLNRIQKSRYDAGGKGINVSKMIAALGGRSMATGFVGGSTGNVLLPMLDDLGLAHDFVHTKGNTRVNLKLLDPVNGITEINEPGIEVTKREEKALFQVLGNYIAEDNNKTIFVLAGSMHRGARPTFYKDLIEVIKRKGAHVLLDADGEAFAHALDASPDFVKPNKEELLRYFNRDIHEDVSIDELIVLGKKIIQEKNVRMLAISLGSKGAIFMNAEVCAVAPALRVEVSSTVGAGDSLVGAVAYAMRNDYSFESTVRLAMAASAGAVTTEGTKAPSFDVVDTLLAQVTFEYK